MESRSETAIADNGATVEIATVTHEGRDFTAMGAVVDHEAGIVVGYPKGNILRDWSGKAIGTCRVVSSWRTPRSYLSDRMYAYRAIVDGKHYHGRGSGDGMLLRLRRSK